MPEINQEISWGFFDGTSQGHPPQCGMGVVPFLKQNHFIHLRYAPGRGTNTRAEFIALWSLLEIAIKKGIKKLQIFGNSKLVIDWVNKNAMVSDIRLRSLLQDILHSLNSLEHPLQGSPGSSNWVL
jgi:ribonuclease HI